MIQRLVRRSLAAVLVLLAILLTPANIFSCGPFFEEPVFTRTSHPDQPLDRYVKGRLGIVLPSYEGQYLIVAYRYLAGPPLSQAEEKALLGAWTADVPASGQQSPTQAPQDDWLDARALALGRATIPLPVINPYRTLPGGWQMYPNCGDDAFTTAVQTVSQLAKTFGVGSEAVRDWIDAQDAVFSNCGANHGEAPGAAAPLLPKPPAMQNAVLRMDRDYQIAAANFYAGNWQTAATQFQQIAQQHDSPWRTWAPYLVARCYIREATLGATGQSSFNIQPMTEAEQRLLNILKDPALAKIHPAAKRLLDFVEVRLHPEVRLNEAAQPLAGHAPTTDFWQDLTDFNWLVRQQLNREGTDPAKWRAELAQRGQLDDFTDWLLTFSRPMPDSLAHSVERWHATKSQAWLMAALTEVQSKDSTAGALADAAAAIAPTSPAYEMAVYHRARLLMGRNDKIAARQLLDANLKRFESGPLSSLNLLLGQRFALAADLHQFLEYAPRIPVELAWDTGVGMEPSDTNQAKPLPKRFDTDSVGIINQRLPLALLSQASTGDVLPQDLREALGTATLTRATILNDAQTAKALQSVALAAHPELRDYATAYNGATSSDARTFDGTWTMLHFPGMKPFVNAGTLRETKLSEINSFRNNWWCEDLGARSNSAEGMYGASWADGSGDNTQPKKPAAPPSPPFLTDSERSAAEREWRELSSIGTAPNYFGRIVLQWAKDHPNDNRLPEALHLVVRATRYGCTDAGTGAISKQAYDVLHAHYPNSSWAKKTPYWFK